MRLGLLSIVLLVACAGCHGSTSVLPPPNPAATFAAIPGPADLLRLDPAYATSSIKAASQLAMFMGDQYDAALPHSDNVAANLGRMQTVLPGRKAPLTFCIYRIAPDVVPAGTPFNRVQVSLDYEGAAPESPDGLYLGISDFTANRWVWFLIPGHATPVELLSSGLTGNAGPEYLVLVNYSDVTTNIANVNFEFGDDGTIGDWLYYTQQAVFPGEGTGIARVPIDGSLPPETIHTGIMGLDYSHPQIRYRLGGDELYYNRNDLGNIDICRSALDGSGETVHRDEPLNQRIMDWSADGSIELYTSGDNTHLAYWYNHTTVGGGAISTTNGNIVEMAVDPFSEISDYAVYLVLEQALPGGTAGLFHVGTDSWPWFGDADTIVYNGTETLQSIVCGRISGGTGVDLTGVWFISDNRNPENPLDTTGNVYIAMTFSPNIANYLVDEEYDFKCVAISPDGSRIAIMVRQPGDPAWDIYVTPTANQHDWPSYSPIVEDDGWGDLEWYSPN